MPTASASAPRICIGIDAGLTDRAGGLAAMAEFFELVPLRPQAVGERPDLCGYVLAQGADGEASVQALRAADPLLPVEDADRLRDDHLRESFIVRVFTCSDWRGLLRQGVSHQSLQDFWARHKYLVMSRHVPTYQALGRLLANTKSERADELAPQLIALIMQALQRPATRRGHTNVLEHIRGYLKRQLTAEEKRELGEVIEQYRTGVVPLNVPLTLLKHFFRRYPDPYIELQVFMQPYSEALGLRNTL